MLTSERVLVGHAPRPRPRLANRPVTYADGWTDQLTGALALVAALITLVAAIWWTASAPMV
jgi:hypothetical protein